MKISRGVAAMKMPESTPMMNIDTNDSANSIGVVNWIFAPQIVPNQLNVLIALGRAINIVATMNVMPSTGLMPETNMWCPHTMKPSPAMPAIEYTIGLYPNNGLRAKVLIMSDTMPMAGRIMMYTAGWL